MSEGVEVDMEAAEPAAAAAGTKLPLELYLLLWGMATAAAGVLPLRTHMLPPRQRIDGTQCFHARSMTEREEMHACMVDAVYNLGG